MPKQQHFKYKLSLIGKPVENRVQKSS